MRLDKWLWAARFFKTRSLASKACELGRIGIGEIKAKASREVKIGDMLHIRNEGGEFHVEVLGLSEMRGPAAVAQTLYRETEESRALRQKLAEERKLTAPPAGGWPQGRPSKKDRRLIIKFRTDI